MRKKDKVRHCCASCLSRQHKLPRKPAVLDYYGEKIYLKDLAKKLNINFSTLSSRIYTYKWDMSRWAKPVKRRIG
jgi:uncharacterized protein YjcR